MYPDGDVFRDAQKHLDEAIQEGIQHLTQLVRNNDAGKLQSTLFLLQLHYLKNVVMHDVDWSSYFSSDPQKEQMQFEDDFEGELHHIKEKLDFERFSKKYYFQNSMCPKVNWLIGSWKKVL